MPTPPHGIVVGAAFVALIAGLSGCESRQPEAVRPREAAIKPSANLESLISTGVNPTPFTEGLRLAWLDPAKESAARGAALAALKRYPPHLIDDHLKEVVILNGITSPVYGPMLGTNDTDRLYVVFKPRRKASVRHLGGAGGVPFRVSIQEPAERAIQRTIHHEFSSILRNEHPRQFPHAEWARANPPGFEYSVRFTKEVADVTWDAALCEQGFLCKYSRADEEEDFNVIAGELFMGDPEFWALVDTYPALRKKVELAAGFYERLDPSLNLSTFRSLATPLPAAKVHAGEP